MVNDKGLMFNERGIMADELMKNHQFPICLPDVVGFASLKMNQ